MPISLHIDDYPESVMQWARHPPNVAAFEKAWAKLKKAPCYDSSQWRVPTNRDIPKLAGANEDGTVDVLPWLLKLDILFASGTYKQKFAVLMNPDACTNDEDLRDCLSLALDQANDREEALAKGLPYILPPSELLLSNELALLMNQWWNSFMMMEAFTPVASQGGNPDDGVLTAISKMTLTGASFKGFQEKYIQIKLKVNQLAETSNRGPAAIMRFIRGMVQNTALTYACPELVAMFDTENSRNKMSSERDNHNKLKCMESSIASLSMLHKLVVSISRTNEVSRANESQNAVTSKAERKPDRQVDRDRDRRNNNAARHNSAVGEYDNDSSENDDQLANVYAARRVKKDPPTSIRTMSRMDDQALHDLEIYHRAYAVDPALVMKLEAEFNTMEFSKVDARMLQSKRDDPDGYEKMAALVHCQVCGMYCTLLHNTATCGFRAFSNPSMVAAIQIAKMTTDQLRDSILMQIVTHGALSKFTGAKLKSELAQLESDVARELEKKKERQRRWLAEQIPRSTAGDSHYGPGQKA
jgi:hypothetical protein